LKDGRIYKYSRITDEEVVSMSRYLVRHDGLFLGSSSACNLVACVKLVRKMNWREGQTVVTILCDRFSKPEWMISDIADE